MTHIWLRAEQRKDEARTPLTPKGAAILRQHGIKVTVEENPRRIFGISDYADVGCAITKEGSWRSATSSVYILGLKELGSDQWPLIHRHIYFGHAYKGQTQAKELLRRFSEGGGTLLDLEYLTDLNNKRVAAFGYWAGFAGAALGYLSWLSLKLNKPHLMDGLTPFSNQAILVKYLIKESVAVGHRPNTIIIGALGRVGSGACDLANQAGIDVTKWDMTETKHGGPFPEILDHDIFMNCILANSSTSPFLTMDQLHPSQRLSVVADIACDPNSLNNPVPIYNRATTISDPVVNVENSPSELLVMAVDNLPSLLPLESSQDFADLLLPHLLELETDDNGVWARAKETFFKHI